METIEIEQVELGVLLSFFLSFSFGVAHAPFTCQRWGLLQRSTRSCLFFQKIARLMGRL